MNTRIQYFLPHHLLSRAMGWFTRLQIPALKNWQIRTFSKHYGVVMEEAEHADLSAYKHFNAFFTRKLKADLRPIDEDPRAWTSPADSCVSQLGAIHGQQLIQAKGQTYTLEALLGDAKTADTYENGHFATLYLSPKDYHRVHMPCDAQLTRMTYIPGRIFSVNPQTVIDVPQLFARNERVVCEFTTEAGPMILVLVGAMLCASIHTTWHGQVTPPQHKSIHVWDYADVDEPVTFKRGEQMGHFELGSTVILLTGDTHTRWAQHLAPGVDVKMGQAIGHHAYCHPGGA